MILTAVLAIVLALLVWAFFYFTGTPLSPSETSVVVGACLLVAFPISKAVQHFRRRKTDEGSAGK